MRNCASSVAKAIALERVFHVSDMLPPARCGACAGKRAAEATQTRRANAEDEI